MDCEVFSTSPCRFHHDVFDHRQCKCQLEQGDGSITLHDYSRPITGIQTFQTTLSMSPITHQRIFILIKGSYQLKNRVVIKTPKIKFIYSF